jgi:hypothetical protein
MVALEIEPGTTVISTHYLHTVEEQSASDHERLIEKEAELLCAWKQADEWQRKLADTQVTAELQKAATQDYAHELEVKWRERFTTLCVLLLVALWLVTVLVIVPHRAEIMGWFR